MPSGWNFHIWELHPETKKPFKYVGFMNDEKSALEWIKKNGKEHYKLLNFGPNALAKGQAMHSDNARKTKRVKPSSRAAEAMAEARAESRRRDEENRKKQEEAKAKREARKREDREAMAGVAKDAEGLLEQHKADEEADLAQGINR